VLTSQQKGNSLESAVRAIETAILRQVPGYHEKTFRIEGNKKIKTGQGVRHEIDIWVNVEIAVGYTATFIFECKNWKANVGKNDIVDFAEKIKVAQAQKGFFVAKSLTRDAKAQAKSDSRIEILLVRELPMDEVPGRMQSFHGIFTEVQDRRCTITHGYEQGTTTPVDLNSSVSFTMGGREHDLSAYLKEWIDEVSGKYSAGFVGEGVYPFEESRFFSANDVAINQERVKQMTVSGKVEVRRIPGVIVSRFEVATRGRVIQCLVEFPNGASVIMQELMVSHKG
jgi:hypothetical protein